MHGWFYKEQNQAKTTRPSQLLCIYNSVCIKTDIRAVIIWYFYAERLRTYSFCTFYTDKRQPEIKDAKKCGQVSLD